MISEASHSASGATAFRLMVQLPPLLERGMLTMSNCTLRQSGWRCQGKGDAGLDLIEGRRRFRKKLLEFHAIPSIAACGRRASDERAGQDCWGA